MIRLLEFHRSSNCAKVRIALNYKGIPFEMEEMSHAERTPMVRTVGWALVPVLLDGEIAMRDSEAILHYLESNYRDKPSLTPTNVEDIRHGEAFTREMQQRLGPFLRRAYGEAMKEPGKRDAGVMKEVRRALEEGLRHLEKALDGRTFLLGDAMSMYDILVAALLMPARPRPDYAAQSAIWAFFQEHLSIPRELANVNSWLDRVLAYDGAGTHATVGSSSTAQ